MIRSYFNFHDQNRSIRQKEKKNWLTHIAAVFDEKLKDS